MQIEIETHNIFPSCEKVRDRCTLTEVVFTSMDYIITSASFPWTCFYGNNSYYSGSGWNRKIYICTMDPIDCTFFSQKKFQNCFFFLFSSFLIHTSLQKLHINIFFQLWNKNIISIVVQCSPKI